MQTFNLDLSIKKIVPLLYAKQRDVGAKICIKLTDNEAEYVVPDDITWSVWYSGASGEGNYDKIDGRDAVVVNGSTATVELIYQMLDNPGAGKMCLVMNSADGTQLGWWNIPYFVEAIPGANSKAAIAYYQAFLQAQAKAEAAAGRAEAAAAKIAVDQEYIETQVFAAGGSAEVAATAANAAAESERKAKTDADRAEEAAERAESAGGGGGTLEPLIVDHKEGDISRATHTAKEIYDYVQNGGAVYVDARDVGRGFVHLSSVEPTKAVFKSISDGMSVEYIIDHDGTYNEYWYEIAEDAVTYTPQNKTEAEKAQARDNIGATDGKGVHQSEENELPNIGDELISADGWTLNGWSGNLENGFVNTAGNTGVLTYTMPESTGTNVYIVSFKSSVTLIDTNLSVRIGGSELFSLYGQIENGVTSDVITIGIQSVDDGDLEFVPDNTFKGTITEISVKRLDGTTLPIQKVVDSNNENTLELRTTTEELDNIFIGKTAGRQNVNGRGNVALGSNALQNVTSGFWNTAIGTNALRDNTAGSRNVAIGRIALQDNICGLRNIAIGTYALNHNKTGNKNIAIGADALDKNENGSENVAIGLQTLYKNVSGNYNTAIGSGALLNSQGNNNSAVGFQSLLRCTTGNANVGIGYSAGCNITTGSSNLAIGINSLYKLKTGGDNVAIGGQAGRGQGTTEGFKCGIFIGTQAGYNLCNNADYNVLIGYQTGYNITTGTNNIVIGEKLDTPTPTTSNWVNIGGLYEGSRSENDKYAKINGGLQLSDIPTTDPAVAGRVWNDNGTLKVSAG